MLFSIKNLRKYVIFLVILSFGLLNYANYSLAGHTSPNGVLDVNLDQYPDQADPANLGTTIDFIAAFSKPIIAETFTVGDINTSASTATGVTVTGIEETLPYDGTNYLVHVTTTGPGKVILTIPGQTTVNFAETGGQPRDIIRDSSGNLYVVNNGDSNITKITSDGVASIFGTTGTGPLGIAMDSEGNIYTANNNDNTVTKITPAGVSSVLGTTGNGPRGVVVDSLGNVYTADYADNTVTKITPAGVSSVFAEVGNHPYDIVMDASGNIYTANTTSNDVSKITPAGVSSILGTTGSGPRAITIDSLGNVYTTNYGSYSEGVTKITPEGSSSVFVGPTDGGTYPESIAVDADNNIYVGYNARFTSDSGIIKVNSDGLPSVLGGNINGPGGIVVDSSTGIVYVSNTWGNNVTKITPGPITSIYGATNNNSIVTDNKVTVLGEPVIATINQVPSQNDPAYTNNDIGFRVVFSRAINPSTFTAADIDTSASTASGVTISRIEQINSTTFDVYARATGAGNIILSIPARAEVSLLGSTGAWPQAVVKDSLGNVYTTNSDDGTISKITPAGVSSVFATTGGYPYAMTIDSHDNLYVTNTTDDNVVKITPAGTISVLAETGADPQGIVMDQDGNLYTANFNGNNITKITPAGVVTTLAETGDTPYAIAIDSDGNLYTANSIVNSVSKITPAGVSTILGSTGEFPVAIAVDSDGNVYTANSSGNNVTKITPAGVSTTFGEVELAPKGIVVDQHDNIYVANADSNTVTEIFPDGTSFVIANTGSNPLGLFIDSADTLYVTNALDNTVTKVPNGILSANGDSWNMSASTSSDNSVTVSIPVSGGSAASTPCKEVTYTDWQPTCVNGWQYRSYLTTSPSNCSLTQEQIDQAKRSCVNSVAENPANDNNQNINTDNPVINVIKFIFNRNLKLGDINNDVKELQKYLNNHGFIVAKKGAGSLGKETTFFGYYTQQALIKFQKVNKIFPSVGYFGPLTRAFINK